MVIKDTTAFERWTLEKPGSPYPYGDVFMI